MDVAERHKIFDSAVNLAAPEAELSSLGSLTVDDLTVFLGWSKFAAHQLFP